MTAVLKHKEPVIERLRFDKAGKICIILQDGREMYVPLRYFQDLKRLTPEKRKKYTIVDDRSILFRYSDMIYHLEDFFGLEENWRKR